MKFPVTLSPNTPLAQTTYRFAALQYKKLNERTLSSSIAVEWSIPSTSTVEKGICMYIVYGRAFNNLGPSILK